MMIQLADIQAAHERIRDSIVRTSCEKSETLSMLTGAEVFLKFENRQFTASFKERGALNYLLQLSDAEMRRGVIAMSAGNHAQGVAYHGMRLGIPVCIVMPSTTPNTKVEQTQVLGAEVVLHGMDFEETRLITEQLAEQKNLCLVHPFNDPKVIAGQGTLGLELVEQVPELDIIIVPVGGGGLISGVATAAKAMCPDIEIIGVQTERWTGAYDMFHGVDHTAAKAGTVAEGIAVKSPGKLTGEIIESRVDDIVLVSEVQIEKAIFSLLEVEKTVTEGAGAASLAAIMAHRDRFKGKKVAAILSGGNIDMMVLSSLVQRGLVRTDRLVRLQVEISDLPGELARLTQRISELNGNVVDLSQDRTYGVASAGRTIVEVELQMRGKQQVEQLMESLARSGWVARLDLPAQTDDPWK
jgi:threonine dehydratase